MSYIQTPTKFFTEKRKLGSKEKEKGRQDFTKRAFCVIICNSNIIKGKHYEIKLPIHYFGML